MKKRLLLLLLLPVLPACDYYTRELPKPTPISFRDDPRILRGVWTGLLKSSEAEVGQTLRLDLSATYVNSWKYAVSGSAQVGTQQVTVSGTVAGGSLHSYLGPQTSPVPSTALLNLRSEDGKTADTMFCDVLNDSVTEPVWKCYPGATYQPFDLKRDSL